MAWIDLNCDLGEGAGNDAELLGIVTSANIACGGHAGDEATMRETARLATTAGVAIGAHPGFVDRAHFGRRELPVAPGAVKALVREQIERLRAITAIGHVKPHGALYNLAARDPAVATEIAEAVAAVDDSLILVGLAGSALVTAGRRAGLRVAGEGFSDRTYQADGSLTPRNRPDAMIASVEASVAQVLGMVRDRMVRTTDGVTLAIAVDTVCLHGDGAHAVAFARRLRAALATASITMKALTRPGRNFTSS